MTGQETDDYNESLTELRERVSREIISDAVQVDRDGDTTEVSLFYHEPTQRKKKLVRTPMGLAVAIKKPETDKLLAELLDDIESVTNPDRMDVEDKNGFYVVTVIFEDGCTW